MSGCFSDSRKRRGYIMVFGTLLISLILVPALGLAIDLGMMYLGQAKLSAAVDAATIAGAGALSRGNDDASQRANAETTANSYFHANYPDSYLWSKNLQVNSVAATDANALRSITTTASVDLPTIFLRIFHVNSRTITVSAKSTRRDVNIIVVMDRSGSLATSGACTPLKAAAVHFVDKFAETRDNLGLITFGTSSRIDYAPATTFKTQVETMLNNVNCTGATSSAQALWQAYDKLVGLNQNGALNAILFFTDGRPTAVTEAFPLLASSTCQNRTTPKTAAVTMASDLSSPLGMYTYSTTQAPPVSSDQNYISNSSGCYYYTSSGKQVYKDFDYAPLTDIWGNSLTATGYKGVTYDNPGLSLNSAQNIESFSTNAADHAALRIRRGDPDVGNGNRSLAGTVIYTIGLGDIDETLLKRIANDPSLSPNPVAAGVQGRYVYAANAADLDQAFLSVASEVLRLAK
jgi:Mg-chelatase subunit ChlD